MAQNLTAVDGAAWNCSHTDCEQKSQRMAASPFSGEEEDSTSKVQSPMYVDYEKYLSALAIRTQPTVLRQNAAKTTSDDYLKMGEGCPDSVTFPLIEADFKLRDGSVVHVDRKLMQKNLKYGVSQGYPELREWLIEFQCKVHSPPTLDPKHPGPFDLIVTNGCNDGLLETSRMLLDEGDFILTEEATFPTVFSMWQSIGAKPYSVKADKNGMVSEDLERVLTAWSDLQPGCRKPRVLYAVTSGGNPTGVNWSPERKRAVYDLARAHDLLIMDDDAYFFLQFDRPLAPSFLSMDLDGRVVRFDTFSKTLAPGLRAAMVTGPAPLLEKVRQLRDFGTVNLSGLTQAMMSQLLRHWGHDGFLRHLDSVMEFYKQKAAKVVQRARRHLDGLAEWNDPQGGLFLWLRVLGVKDSRVIVAKALERRLILVAGVHFMPAYRESPYIRMNYAASSEDECDKAFEILADVIREERAGEA